MRCWVCLILLVAIGTARAVPPEAPTEPAALTLIPAPAGVEYLTADDHGPDRRAVTVRFKSPLPAGSKLITFEPPWFEEVVDARGNPIPLAEPLNHAAKHWTVTRWVRNRPRTQEVDIWFLGHFQLLEPAPDTISRVRGYIEVHEATDIEVIEIPITPEQEPRTLAPGLAFRLEGWEDNYLGDRSLVNLKVWLKRSGPDGEWVSRMRPPCLYRMDVVLDDGSLARQRGRFDPYDRSHNDGVHECQGEVAYALGEDRVAKVIRLHMVTETRPHRVPFLQTDINIAAPVPRKIDLLKHVDPSPGVEGVAIQWVGLTATPEFGGDTDYTTLSLEGRLKYPPDRNIIQFKHEVYIERYEDSEGHAIGRERNYTNKGHNWSNPYRYASRLTEGVHIGKNLYPGGLGPESISLIKGHAVFRTSNTITTTEIDIHQRESVDLPHLMALRITDVQRKVQHNDRGQPDRVQWTIKLLKQTPHVARGRSLGPPMLYRLDVYDTEGHRIKRFAHTRTWFEAPSKGVGGKRAFEMTLDVWTDLDQAPATLEAYTAEDAVDHRIPFEFNDLKPMPITEVAGD